MTMNDARLPESERDPELDRLYAAAAREEPPAALDDAIRAAARREVSARPRAARLRAWYVPVSVAAMIVVSASLVLLMREEGADRLEPETFERAQPPASAATEAPQPAAPARDVDAAKTGEAPAVEREARAVAPSQKPAAPAGQAPAPPAGASQERLQEPEAAARSREEQAAAPAFAPRRDTPDRISRGVAEDASGAAPTVAPLARQASRSRLMAASPRLLDGAVAQELKHLASEPPARWRERIETLRRGGRSEVAEVLVAEYRRRFPGEPVPEKADP